MEKQTVEYGVQTIELRYTKNERKELEKRFGMGLLDIIQKQVMPTNADGQFVGGGVWDAQVALVHAGMKHVGQAMTERKVEAWLDEISKQEGVKLYEVLNAVTMAILTSGVLGFVYKPPVDDEGKGDGVTPEGSQS